MRENIERKESEGKMKERKPSKKKGKKEKRW